MYKDKNSNMVVLGVGNILRQDEGVGVHIVNELENSCDLTFNPQLIDGGTLGVDLIPLIENADKLIIIDAVKNDREPGTVYKMRYKELNIENNIGKLSLHQIDLIDTLKILEMQNKLPKEIILIGVEPKKLDWGEELSNEVKEKIPEIKKMVYDEIVKKEVKNACSFPKAK